MTSSGREWLRKLDARLRDLFARAETQDARVDAIIRFEGAAARLGELGVSVRSVAGSIVTGSFALRDLPRIAGAPETHFIELSRMLGRDERGV